MILDEAQDLSAMQCRAVGRRCGTGSATILGDIAQGTTQWATREWRITLQHLGKADARIEILHRGYRVPRQIIDYASLLLPCIAPETTAPVSVREAAGSLAVHHVPEAKLAAEIVTRVRDALTVDGSVGVITSAAYTGRLTQDLTEARLGHHVLGDHDEEADDAEAARLSVVPAALAKGLEFDHVIVVEPAAITSSEERGLRWLYVVLTRAVSRLTVVHTRPLPAPLT